MSTFETEDSNAPSSPLANAEPVDDAGTAVAAPMEILSPKSPKSDGWDDDDDDDDDAPEEPSAGVAMFKQVIKACTGACALYTFNMIALLVSVVIIGGQMAVADEMDFKNAELLVLGGTIAALGILSLMGLYGTNKKAQTMLRLYTFGLLVLIMLQMSILAVLLQNIASPESTFVGQFIMLLGPLCEANAEMNAFAEGFGEETVMNVTDNSTGSWAPWEGDGSGDGGGVAETLAMLSDGPLLGQLCSCLDNVDQAQPCLQDFFVRQEQRVFISMAIMWCFEGLCAFMAYSYVSALDEEADSTAETSMKIKKRPAREEVVVDMDTLLDPFAGSAAIFTIIKFKLQDAHDACHREAVILTNTWYFEGTVLFASFANFLVMAKSSRASPPNTDLLAVILIGEIFVTLFLSFEVMIDVAFKMTKAEFLHLNRNPWILIDIVVLAVSWMYLLNPASIFSIGRVLRVLRPLRTLRMLSDIGVVLETMVEAVPLFGQACLLVSFMLTAYSLIGMSLWAGGMRYHCALDDSQEAALLAINATPPETIECPASLLCGGKEVEMCSINDPPTYIRSENFGFTGFDDFPQSFLTMFVQMTGDNGMQDIPFAIEGNGVSMALAGWIIMATAVIVLTTTALNLFLAVCCSVFDDVMGKIGDRQRAALERELKAGYELAAAGDDDEDDEEEVVEETGKKKKKFGLKSLKNNIGKATKKAAEKAKEQGDKAREKLKPSDVLFLDYEQKIRNNDWSKSGSKIPKLRNWCKRIVLSQPCNFTINCLIGVNAIILCSNHHGISQEWQDANFTVEGICLIIYWFEFFGKILGYGFGVYMSESMNKMDTFVLVSCSTGFIGSLVTLLARFIPGLGAVGDGLKSFNAIRIVKLMRALQMSRWIMKHKELKDILQTVFKSWESIILIAIFAVFSMVCFAVVAMSLFGGGLGVYPEVTLEDYPRRNVETFANAFFQSCQFITGEAWSTTMYWYMENSGSPKYLVAFFFVTMFTWLNCIIFSLFVAVLLINFSIDEDEMLPKQRVKYEFEESLKLPQGSALLKLLRPQKNMADEGESANVAPTAHTLLLEWNLVNGGAATQSMDAGANGADEGYSGNGATPAAFDDETENEELDQAEEQVFQAGEAQELDLSERVMGGEDDDVENMPLGATKSTDDDPMLSTKSLGIFDTTHPFRLVCAQIESHPWFESLVTYLVLTSCFVIAFEDPEMVAKYKIFFDIFNGSILVVFVVEMFVKIIVSGWKTKCGPTPPYMAAKTNKLDLFVIVAITITYLLPLFGLATDESQLSRILRLVRILAPMLELVRKDEIASLFRTFWLALPAIGAVVFLLAILLTMFGIVGVEYFAGKLYRCVHAQEADRCDAAWRLANKPLTPDIPYDCYDGMMTTMPLEEYSFEEVGNSTDCEMRKFDCLEPGADPSSCALWLNPPFNFDNIFEALMSLFYLATVAGWVDFMEKTMDITDVDQSPQLDSFAEAQIYYFFFTIVFSTFMLNLFIGVLGNAFSEQNGTNLITSSQIKWIRAKAMLRTYSPEEAPPNRPETGVFAWKVRQFLYDLSLIEWLDQVWTAGILVNVGVLLSDHFPTSTEWDFFVASVNLVCLLVFTAEFSMKMIGYGFTAFIENKWQRLDLFVIIGSWGSMFIGMKAGAGVIRAFRTVRLALLVKRMPGLMSLIDTVIACISPSISICAISALFFYVYAILGMKLFGSGEIESIGGYANNFQTFMSSLTMLFQMINGQTLYVIMWDMREFGAFLPFMYICTFYFILVYLCMNLLIVAVLENFGILASLDEDHFGPDDLDIYMEAWHRLTFESIYDVEDNQIANSRDKLRPQMTDEDLKKFAELKVAQEDKMRLQQWAQFLQRFPKAKYLETTEPMFNGWVRMAKKKAYYFWLDNDVEEEGTAGYRSLNWYSEGHSDDELQEMFEKNGRLVTNRVRVTKVHTDMPPMPLTSMNSRDFTGGNVEQGAVGDTDGQGGVTTLGAALSGRSWLLSIAKAQGEHPANIMCKFFDLDYYENVLGEGEIATQDDLETMKLTQKMRDVLLDEDLTPLQMRFRQCIEVGYIIPDCYLGSKTCTSGVIICDPTDYDEFWPFFGQVLQEIHGADVVSLEGEGQPVSHRQQWELDKVTIVLTVTFANETDEAAAGPSSPRALENGGVSPRALENGGQSPNGLTSPQNGLNGAKSPSTEALETDHLDLSRVNVEPLDMWLSVNRNIEGFTMCATMRLEERMACEDVVERAVQLFLADPQWSGKYVSLTPGHPDEISLSEYKLFVEDGLMFAPATNDARMVVGGLAQDWPYGRGAYISADEMTTIWVGYGDHITINARDPDTEFVDLLLERLRVSTALMESNDAVEFRRHEKCGFITTMPLNAGTGMQAVANLPCPNLTYDGTVDIVKQVIREEGLDLEVRAVPERRWYPCGDTHEVGDEGVNARGMIQVALTRTYGVTEGWIVQKMYKSLSRLNELNLRYESQARKWKAKEEKRKLKMVKLLKRFEEAEEDARDAADLAHGEAGNKDLKIEFDIEIIDAEVLTEDAHRKKFGHEHFEKDLPVLRTITMFADSEEQYASWLVVLHWLADDCQGVAPVQDPRMAPGGIAPRRLTQDEWATMRAVIGLIDLPFSSLRTFFGDLQTRGVLGMSDSHDREYLLYATFQMELYAYQTTASDIMREEFKIDDLLQPCAGLNYRHVLSRLCLLNYGKVGCLPYAESMDSCVHETQMVALRLIQTAVGEWIARRAWQKNPEAHPNAVLHTFWRAHPTTYLVALRAARNTRLRTLKLLMKLVRKTRPVAMTMEELEISRKMKGMLPMAEVTQDREMEVEFDGTGGLDSPSTDLRETANALEVLREDSPSEGIGGMGGRASEHAMSMLMPAEEIDNPIQMAGAGGLGGEAWNDDDTQEV